MAQGLMSMDQRTKRLSPVFKERYSGAPLPESANGTFGLALCLAYTQRHCANVCMPDATQNPCSIQLTGQGSTGMDPQEVVGVLPRDGGGEEGAASTCAKLSTAQQQVVNALGNRRSFCQVKVLAVYVFVCLWHTRDCLSTIPARAEMNIQSESVRRLHASQSWGGCTPFDLHCDGAVGHRSGATLSIVSGMILPLTRTNPLNQFGSSWDGCHTQTIQRQHHWA